MGYQGVKNKPRAGSSERKQKVNSKPTTPKDGQGAAPAMSVGFPSLGGETIKRAGIGFALLVFGSVVLWGIAYLNGFVALKQFLAEKAGLYNPRDIAQTNIDIALVLWAFGAIAVSEYVKQGGGIITLLFFRPWLDGYTFPTDNLYFVWGIFALAALHLIRAVVGRQKVHIHAALVFFLLFWLSLLLVTPFSYQLDRTLRGLLLWFTYGVLLFLTYNLSQDASTRRLLLGGLLLTVVSEAVFSILHYAYLLPYLRRMIQNPDVLEQFFQTREMTPELARRFNISRAFGSMLFPNALAAFLLLFIPWTYLGAYRTVKILPQAFRESRRAVQAESLLARRYRATAVAFAAWFVSACSIFAMFQFPASYLDVLPFYMATPLSQALTAGLAGVLFAGVFFFVADRVGMTGTQAFAVAAGLSIAAVVQGWALWLTFSRGAWLSLLLSVLCCGLLLYLNRQPSGSSNTLWRIGSRVITCVMVIAFALVLFEHGLNAESTAPTAPATAAKDENQTTAAPSRASSSAGNTTPGKTSSTAKQAKIVEEGVTLKAEDLANPESFRLRLGYWRVARNMFFDNWLTGVGLGCFGIAYGRYQDLDAGDVREAHNGYVQFLAETGIVTGGLFIAFWVWLLYGFWRNLGQRRGKDWQHIGVFAGLLAFLLHSGIDINFSHPTLAMFAFALLGVYFAQPPQGSNWSSVQENWGRVIACLVLGLLLAMFVLSQRIFMHDLLKSRMSFINIGDERVWNERYQIAQLLYEKFEWWRWQKNPRPLDIPVSMLNKFFADPECYRNMGIVYVTEGEGNQLKGRELDPSQPIPPNAVVRLQRPGFIRKYTNEAMLDYISGMSRNDAYFPYTPDTARYIAELYHLLLDSNRYSKIRERYPEFIKQFSYWTDEYVRRSPQNPDGYALMGQSLWLIADLSGEAGDPLFDKALEALRTAQQMAPNRTPYMGLLCYFLRQRADQIEKAGRPGVEALRQEAQALQDRIGEIIAYRHGKGLE